MKRSSIIFALILSVVLCVLCLASCGEKTGPAVTTTQSPVSTTGTPAASELTTTTAPETECVHEAKADYTIETEPTCTTTGVKKLFCSRCREVLDTQEIPIDPEAHVLGEWVNVEPTLLAPKGSRSTSCTLCNTPIVEELELEYYVVNSTMDVTSGIEWNNINGVNWAFHKDTPNGFAIKTNINDVKEYDVHYYPTEENPQGNDLLVEVSFLWNETLENGYKGDPLTFAHVDGYDLFHIKANLDAKERDGFTYEYLTPTPGEIAVYGDAKNPPLGEFGWHRLGFRVHQEAEIVSGNVEYTYIASAYVDGKLVLSIDATDYAVNRNPGSSVTALLFTAEIDAADPTKLNCFDIGDPLANSSYLKSYAILMFEDFFGKSDTGAYIVLADISVTCGQNFVQTVEENYIPDTAEFVLDDKGTITSRDDLTVPATIWYQAK